MSANVRRQIYLVFKECLHNLIHHSGSTEARVSLVREEGRLSWKSAITVKGSTYRATTRDRVWAVCAREPPVWEDRSSGHQARGTTVNMRVPLHT